MLFHRQELQEALCQYSTDTLTDINTVSGFCEGISAWKDARKTEFSKLEDIKDKAAKVDLSFSHVTKSETKAKALGEYVKSKMTSSYADRSGDRAGCGACRHSERFRGARPLPGGSGEAGGHLTSCVHGGEPGVTPASGDQP